jgi:hypothetical protein
VRHGQPQLTAGRLHADPPLDRPLIPGGLLDAEEPDGGMTALGQELDRHLADPLIIAGDADSRGLFWRRRRRPARGERPAADENGGHLELRCRFHQFRVLRMADGPGDVPSSGRREPPRIETVEEPEMPVRAVGFREGHDPLDHAPFHRLGRMQEKSDHGVALLLCPTHSGIVNRLPPESQAGGPRPAGPSVGDDRRIHG